MTASMDPLYSISRNPSHHQTFLSFPRRFFPRLFHAHPPTPCLELRPLPAKSLDSGAASRRRGNPARTKSVLRCGKQTRFRHGQQPRSPRRSCHCNRPASWSFLRPRLRLSQSSLGRPLRGRNHEPRHRRCSHFWLATEDHDLAEVNHAFWNTRNGLARYELPAIENDAGRSCRRSCSRRFHRALSSGSAAQTLEGPFAENVAHALHESYTRDETYGTAFGN